MSLSPSCCKATTIALLAVIANACSTRPYRSSSPENLTIITGVRTGSAELQVYDIDKTCLTTYQGTVDLSDQKVRIALPAHKPSYLVVNFSSYSPFTGSRSSTYPLYLTPRTGFSYEANVNYIDNMFGATVYEVNDQGSKRKMPRADPACASK